MHSLVCYCGHHRGRDVVSSIGNLNNYERDDYKNVSLKIEAALFQTSNADDFFRSGMLKDCIYTSSEKEKEDRCLVFVFVVVVQPRQRNVQEIVWCKKVVVLLIWTYYCFLAVLGPVAVVVVSGRSCHDIKNLKSKLLGINSRIWERKGGNYTEALAEFQVSAVFNTRDHIRRNDLPIFIELCMKTPSWYQSGWALWAPTYAGRY